MNAEKQKIVYTNPPGEWVPDEEGPSGSKDKGIDARNWGNADLNKEEAHIEAQRAVLDSLCANLLLERNEPSTNCHLTGQ